MVEANITRDEELRAKLRPIFEKFDIDNSGTVSTDEMINIVAAANLSADFSEEQIKKMIAEADSDNSGEIDFDEFVSIMERQMQSGGGDFSMVFTKASLQFGFLNQLTWFRAAAPETELEAPPLPPRPPRSTLRKPGEPQSPVRVFGGGTWWISPSSKFTVDLDSPVLQRGMPPQAVHQSHASPMTISSRRCLPVNASSHSSPGSPTSTITSLPAKADTLSVGSLSPVHRQYLRAWGKWRPPPIRRY